jgi:hypothetical protein
MHHNHHTHPPQHNKQRLRSPEEVLAKAVPASSTGAGAHAHPHHHHPHQWASDPPRSPLDLLASLPQIDMFTAPHSSHQQQQQQQQHHHHHHQHHAPTSPSITPRTQNWFETHFPNMGSPLPASSHHHQQPPAAAPPSVTTPTGASASSVHLRFPVDAGLGAAGYWMPSSGGGHAGERAGEAGGGSDHGHGQGREPLRLRHFGPL